MSLDPRFICTSDVDTYYVDKDTGLPLAAGIITFYSDNSRTIKKSVYQLTGTAGAYDFAPLPNPCTLSISGTFQDAMGNNIVPYYFPYYCKVDGDPDTSTGVQELYFINVESSGNINQLTRQAWPPSASANGDNDDQTLKNYIPNGQFLFYNTGGAATVNALTLGALGNVDQKNIAQGGWSFNRTTAGTGIYTVTFNALTQGITSTHDYPHAELVFGCSSIGTDSTRDIQIRWPDVFKFSAEDEDLDIQEFTFFMATQTRDGQSRTFDVRRINFYGTGGTPSTSTDDSIGTISFGPGYDYQSLSVSFSDNSGKTKGTNGDDYVAIALRAPQTTFSVALTDVGLVAGSQSITTYPLKTNAEMQAEGIAGWMPDPDPAGNDLYLPLILTPKGMTFDHSKIGNIESSVLSSTYKAGQPQLYCDGSSYITANYSALGIPYARLGNILTSDSPVPNVPKYGTGLTYATSYATVGNQSLIRITSNTAGILTAAADGNTGWTIGNIYIGVPSIGIKVYNNVANTIFVVGPTPLLAPTAGTSGFTVTVNNSNTGITDGFAYSYEILTISAAGITPGSYIFFSSASTNYYLWFKVNGAGSDPGPFGGRSLLGSLDLLSSYTAQDVANALREAMNQFQISTVLVGGVPTAGQYFTFYANTSMFQQYAVWYSVNNIGTEPVGHGITIKVSILSTDTTTIIATKTLAAINSYSYEIPDLRGMFLRGLDPNGTWDLDVALRWSTVTGISGANLGTFEYQQVIGHTHVTTVLSRNESGAISGVISSDASGATDLATPFTSSITGGTETRPVNASVNFFINY